MLRAFIIILIFAGFSLSQVRDDYDQLLHLAETYERAANYKEANKIYENLFKKNPNRYRYFNGYVRTLTALKEYDKVINLCSEKISKNPNDANTYGTLGSVYFLKGEKEKAENIWQDFLRNHPNPSNYRTIANYAIQVRDLEFAINLLKKGKENAGNISWLFSFDLANLFAITMDYKDAVKEYCNILRNNPKQFYTIKNKINTFLTSKKFSQEVVKTLEECNEISNNDKLAELLVSVYMQVGSYDKAFSVMKELDERTNSNGKKLYSFANKALSENYRKIAAKTYSYILKNYAEFFSSQNLKFNYAKALIEIAKSEKNNYNNWKPLNNRICYDEKDFKKPIEILNEIAEGNIGNNIVTESIINLSDLYFSVLCDYPKADSLYSFLLKFDKNSKQLQFYLLRKAEISILTSHNFELAKKFLFEARKKQISSEKVLNRIFYLSGKINFWQGKFNEANKYFDNLAMNKKSDFSNDAIEMKLLISFFAKDSLSLLKYSNADYNIFSENFDFAVTLLTEISDNKSLLFLNNIAKLKIAEIYILENKYKEAEKILNYLIKKNIPEIFPDKPLKYLADIYYYNYKDFNKAFEFYNNFLEKYPESLYINDIREKIKKLDEIKNE